MDTCTQNCLESQKLFNDQELQECSNFLFESTCTRTDGEKINELKDNICDSIEKLGEFDDGYWAKNFISLIMNQLYGRMKLAWV